MTTKGAYIPILGLYGFGNSMCFIPRDFVKGENYRNARSACVFPALLPNVSKNLSNNFRKPTV